MHKKKASISSLLICLSMIVCCTRSSVIESAFYSERAEDYCLVYTSPDGRMKCGVIDRTHGRELSIRTYDFKALMNSKDSLVFYLVDGREIGGLVFDIQEDTLLIITHEKEQSQIRFQDISHIEGIAVGSNSYSLTQTQKSSIRSISIFSSSSAGLLLMKLLNQGDELIINTTTGSIQGKINTIQKDGIVFNKEGTLKIINYREIRKILIKKHAKPFPYVKISGILATFLLFWGIFQIRFPNPDI